MDNMQKLQRRKDMENYSQELAHESDTRKREQRYNEEQQKRYEFEQAMNKKKEADFLNHQTQLSKKNMQNMLAKDYEDAMRLKRMQKQDERNLTLAEGRAADHKAELELNYLRNAERDKRNMIREILTTEKSAYDDRKNRQTSQSYIMGRAEHQKLMEENEKKEAYKDYLNSQKYNNFNQFQNKVSQNYQDHVYRPEQERKMKIDYAIKKGEEERKKRDDMTYQYKQNVDRNMRLNNRAFIEKQMKEKKDGRVVGKTEFEVDQYNRMNHEKNVQDVEHFEKFKKKQEQHQYREMLNDQIKTSKMRRLYGNMTGVEKSLNKDDLLAWKNYDHNAYALIPGLNSTKKPIPKKLLEDKNLHKKERSFDEELNRMNQFGLTRDVTLARDPAYISANLHNSAKRLPDSRSLEPNRSMMGSAGGQSLRGGYEDNVNQSVPKNAVSNEIPNRSLLRSGHRKYPNHHLFSNYNPINGEFGSTNAGKSGAFFKKMGTSVLY